MVDSLPFIEPEGSSVTSAEPVTGSYPRPDESSQHLPIPLQNDV
jgi:hypothetical protein